ncbi:MAG: LON peptidase substrate-binding domain-containing protein [Halofilum sp. (in: g-proteobacteria)]|nr:LON peptidase substrate-binding domain-containing protein [Halofilum sp. (in: g-proteobacteria)]
MSDTGETYRLPLFPLSSVVLPGGLFALRLFEARYLDLVSECLRNDSGFGICLVRQGGEAGEAALPYGTGTEVRIVDWDRQPDGLLGITVAGQHKIRVHDLDVEANQLVVAQVTALPPEPAEPVPEQCRGLVDVLAKLLRQLDSVIAYEQPRRTTRPGSAAASPSCCRCPRGCASTCSSSTTRPRGSTS